MLALWISCVILFFSSSVGVHCGSWYCWYWCRVLCWRDLPPLLQLCLVHCLHATLEILNHVFYHQLAPYFKHAICRWYLWCWIWYYWICSRSRAQWAPNVLSVPASLLSIHFIFRVSCFALLLLFSFSFSPWVSVIGTLMCAWLCSRAFLSFVSWLVSNCLHFLVLDVDFLLPWLFHWSWHATWTRDAASWRFHCATLQHHSVIIYRFLFYTCIFLVSCRYVSYVLNICFPIIYFSRLKACKNLTRNLDLWHLFISKCLDSVYQQRGQSNWNKINLWTK